LTLIDIEDFRAGLYEMARVSHAVGPCRSPTSMASSPVARADRSKIRRRTGVRCGAPTAISARALVYGCGMVAIQIVSDGLEQHHPSLGPMAHENHSPTGHAGR